MSAILSDCDVSSIADLVEGTLDKTCTILRETRTPDDIGGQVVTWQEVETDVACRIVRSDVRFVQQTDRVATVSDTRIVVGRGHDVQMGDKLILDTFEYRVESAPMQAPSGTLTLGVSLWRP